jgi:predicted PurR-regulated permease PerM
VLGTAVVFGMTVATTIGIFLVPVFYVVVVRLSERWRRGAPARQAPAA